MKLNFFATGHGKGEVDGVGTLFKHEVRKEQLKPKGQKIQNVTEFVAFLKVESNKYHVTHLRAKQHMNKYFHEVKVSDVNRSRPFDCEIVKGSRKLHQV
jgi:hypothetical protein